MAWIEQSGNQTWRVRYRREDNTIGAINGFATKAAATDHANTLESDQRQGQFIDPAAGKDHPGELVDGLVGRPGCGDPDRRLLPQPAAPPRPTPLGGARPGRHLRDQSRRLGQTTARPGLLAGDGGQRDEAAVAAAVRRRRRTPHRGQPDPRAAPRTTPQRPAGRTPVGHPLGGARGRRQRRPPTRSGGRRRRC